MRRDLATDLAALARAVGPDTNTGLPNLTQTVEGTSDEDRNIVAAQAPDSPLPASGDAGMGMGGVAGASDLRSPWGLESGSVDESANSMAAGSEGAAATAQVEQVADHSEPLLQTVGAAEEAGRCEIL